MTGTSVTGRIVRKDAEVIMIFRVDHKYYKSTDTNKELFEAYLHTGDESYLDNLTNELEY